jgi:hypothetical protein
MCADRVRDVARTDGDDAHRPRTRKETMTRANGANVRTHRGGRRDSSRGRRTSSRVDGRRRDPDDALRVHETTRTTARVTHEDH